MPFENKDNIFRLTLTGVMLFGSSQAQRRLRPMMKVDYIRVNGKEWVQDTERRFESTLEIRDCWFIAIHRALNAVLDDLPVTPSFGKGTFQRAEVPLIPALVLREGIVNALMHRSYQITSPVQIIRYSDRIEIYNAGHSLKPTQNLEETGSVPRNPNIATVLLDTGFSENKGSGIRLMQRMMTEAGLQMPVFKSNREGNYFRATYYFQHFLTPETMRWLKRFVKFTLSDEQVRCLVFVREKGRIDNPTYRDFSHLDTLQASKALRKLCRIGILELQGKGRHSFYILHPEYAESESSSISSELLRLPAELLNC